MGSLNSPSAKPIFLVTHPRAVSTAFERVFLTRESDITCVHEPFSDAYHWGPEKLSERYENVEKLRNENGYEDYTYHAALKLIEDAKVPVSEYLGKSEPRAEMFMGSVGGTRRVGVDVLQGKRVFVKDMAKTLMPLPGEPAAIAPSLRHLQATLPNGNRAPPTPPPGENGIPNPTVIPPELLTRFHITFLIRNPRRSIPSLYECSTPPKSSLTGWHGFKAEDAGYHELRRLFDYLVRIKHLGPSTENDICIVDADDLLTYPEKTVARFCSFVDIPFQGDALQWGTEKDQERARYVFKNWAPFHDAVLKSTSLKAQPLKRTSPEADLAEWTCKFGREAAALIEKNVEDNMADYLYLKQFAIKPNCDDGGLGVGRG